jgi:hypothetical protein
VLDATSERYWLLLGGLLGAHVLLFSSGDALLTILREAAAETLGSEFTLGIEGVGQPSSQDTLCVWDFVPGQTVFPQGILMKTIGGGACSSLSQKMLVL